MTSQLFFDLQSSVFLARLLPSRGKTLLKLAVSCYWPCLEINLSGKLSFVAEDAPPERKECRPYFDVPVILAVRYDTIVANDRVHYV